MVLNAKQSSSRQYKWYFSNIDDRSPPEVWHHPSTLPMAYGTWTSPCEKGILINYCIYIYILYIYIFIYRTSIFGFQQLVDLGNQMILNLHPISRNQGPWYQPKLLFGKPINTNMSYMAKGHPEVGWAPIVFAVRPSQHCILWSLYRVIYKFALVDPHLIWVWSNLPWEKTPTKHIVPTNKYHPLHKSTNQGTVFCVSFCTFVQSEQMIKHQHNQFPLHPWSLTNRT